MRVFVFSFLIIAIGNFFLFTSANQAHAEAYPCSTYSGSNECIDLSITPSCSGTTPDVTWKWTKKFGNTQFSIVYTRGSNWYILRVGNVTSVSMPPSFGGPGSGGSDSGPLNSGERISGKISGGNAPNITTGYTPDVSTTVPNCANTPTPTHTPTPALSATPTLSPTPPGPTATPTPILTTGDITLHFEAIDDNNTPPPGNQLHSSRNIVLFLYKDTGANGIDFTTAVPTYIKTGTVDQVVDDTVQYNGNFRKRNFPMLGVESGNYYFLVKSKEGSLVEHVGNNPITIVAGVNNVLVDIDNTGTTDGASTTAPLLRMGDIVTDCTGTSDPSCSYNKIDILDYNALKDCFGPAITSANGLNHQLSNGHQYNIADLNDDGQVDGVDYTILLKHFGQQGVGNTTQNGGKDH